MTMTLVDRNGLLTDKIRDFAERRLQFALSRFDSKVQKVTVFFEDENGPRGGIDKACRIVVKLLKSNDVVVNDQDADLETCVARAAERAGRAVARAVDRSRTFDRFGAAYTEEFAD